MLHLHFAPSADLLVTVLLDAIRSVWKDPFLPPTLIVPNPAVGRWLQLRLADCPPGVDGKPLALGCVANIKMETMERFFWQVLTPDPGMRLLNVGALQQVLCALLNKERLNDKKYAGVSAYLTSDHNGAIDPRKRLQLAGHIAKLFQEYEFNRPSVWQPESGTWKNGADAQWLNGSPYFDPAGRNDNERWQRDLYKAAYACLNRESGWIPLTHLHRMRRSKGAAPALPSKYIFLFGVNKISHFHRNFMVELSEVDKAELTVCCTNPCAEFWEDVDTLRHRRRWNHASPESARGVAPRRPDDYEKSELREIAPQPDDQPLLELWGHMVKENVYLWCPSAEWDFDYHAPQPTSSPAGPDPAAGVLQRLKQALLQRTSQMRLQAAAPPEDASLQILAAPSPGREMDVLRTSIIEGLKDSVIKSLDEVAVYMPDLEPYIPHIHRVFGAHALYEKGCLPFALLGAPAGAAGLFVQGLACLASCAEGKFTRAQVFALLRNPMVQQARGYNEAMVDIWEVWARELCMYRGYDREHRLQMGDRGETVTEEHTFIHGIRRLLLGNLANEPTAIGIPYRDFETPDMDTLEAFCAAVEELYAAVMKLRTLVDEGAWEKALDFFEEIIRDWFADAPADGEWNASAWDASAWNASAEAGARREFLDSLKNVRLRSLAAPPGETMEFSEFMLLVAACLPGELPQTGTGWIGKITFAPLRPGWVLPHPMVIAAGLNAGVFPGLVQQTPSNLLQTRRLIGDPDPVRDNRSVFLELLHAAGRRLIVSYQARNLQKDEILQPSSVVCELESYLRGQAAADVRHEIPVIAREIGRRKRARHRFPETVQVRKNETAAAPLRVSLRDIRKFLKNPLEYHLSRSLRVNLDNEESTAAAADEPLVSSALDTAALQKAVWKEMLSMTFPENENRRQAGPGECPAEITAHAQEFACRLYIKHTLEGAAPEGYFREVECRKLVDDAGTIAAECWKLAAEFPDYRLLTNTDLLLGRNAGTGLPAGELAIQLQDGRECRATVTHDLALMPRQGREGLPVIAVFGNNADPEDDLDLWVSALLQGIFEAHTMNTGQPRQARQARQARLHQVLLDRNTMKARIRKDFIIQREKAMAWLKDRLTEMLVTGVCEHLPFQLIQNAGLERVTREALQEKTDDAEYGYKSFLPAFELVEARIPDNPEKTADKRYRLFFDQTGAADE